MELTEQLKQGMQAFEAFKSEISPLLAKAKDLDGIDGAKFSKMEKAISDTIELSQKEAAKSAALEAEVKAMAAAMQRPGVSADQAKEKAEIATKAFNEFARSGSDNKTSFREFLKSSGKDLELKDLSVNVEASGGYLVMPTFGGIVTTKAFESSPIRQLATVQPISTDSYDVVVDYNETGGVWIGETASRTVTTTPDIGKINIPTQEAMVYVQATQKILDDAAVNMESWLAEKTADKLARLEATAFVTGDGVATPRGITTYASGTTLSSGQIQQVNMGSTSAFVYDGLVDVQNALKEVYQGNASWLMKRGTFGTLMKLKTGIASDNTPVFNMNYGQNNGLPTFTLLGRPVYFADDLAAIGSASLSVVYGDIKAAYTVVDRIGLRTLRDPFSTAGYVKFYTTKRVGGGVVNFEAVKISKFS